jgi:hypothetical protein
MANPAGESKGEAPRLDCDRRLMLQFRGSVVTSDAGLLPYRKLDDALDLSTMAGESLADARTGKNGRHGLAGLFRQSVFGRLAGYEDVNDAERLRHDPAMRWIVGGKAALNAAASRRPRKASVCRAFEPNLWETCVPMAEDSLVPAPFRRSVRIGRDRRPIETARPCRKPQIEASFFRVAPAILGMSAKFKHARHPTPLPYIQMAAWFIADYIWLLR